jgi:class 3 adenylate cyclase
MPQRVLAAIVITDAVGFTARAGHDEEAALSELQADFSIMRGVAESRGGTVIKTTGDGLLMKFDSAWDAVESSIEIQGLLSSRPAEKYKHRIGVHLCDVVLDENDAHGDGVNLAARLQEQAEPGGIVLSKTTLEIVKSRLSVEPVSLGRVQLKNIPDRTEIFAIGPSGTPKKGLNAKKRWWDSLA